MTELERSFYLLNMSTKRQDIVDAANRTFYRDGFAEVGIDRVTGEANVALGTLYRHFKTRSEIIAAALRQRHDEFLLALGSEAKDAHGAECVLELFDVLEGWSDEHGGNGCFFLRAAADYPTDKIVRDAALSHKREYIALIRERLLHGGWPKDRAEYLASMIFVLLEGAVAAAFTLGDRAAVAAARKTAALVLVNVPPASG
ncbi:TetR/AcrR family transcriptional regulator [Oceanibaculum nanhaiense]|uniref:TetR/AcrR family transcriptional regulator n=1 Tax=Oceanibaculum nanhaiense TaxID=1909734 RepID=UPI00396E9E78